MRGNVNQLAGGAEFTENELQILQLYGAFLASFSFLFWF